MMQDRGMRAVSVPVTTWGVPVSSGRILLILEAAVICDGTGWSSWFQHSWSIAMVGGVLPVTMLREKATIWPLSAVLLAYEKGVS